MIIKLFNFSALIVITASHVEPSWSSPSLKTTKKVFFLFDNAKPAPIARPCPNDPVDAFIPGFLISGWTPYFPELLEYNFKSLSLTMPK